MKKLVIVCEDETRKYGDFLAQLVSAFDDKEDGEIVGVKDGTVKATVWTEKEYIANTAQLSSEQHIIFIGNSKLMKSKREHMLKKYEEYGIQYGWLGKQATLFIEGDLSLDEYEQFIDFAKNYKPDLKALVTKKIIEDEQNNDGKVIEHDKGEPIEEKDNTIINTSIQKIKSVIDSLGELIGNAVDKSETSIKMAYNSKKIKEQQYSCAILLLYLNDLSSFLGL